MFLLGLEYGGVTYPWKSATVISLIVAGAVTVFLFFVNEWKFAKYPVLPLRLFKTRTNVASLLVCFIHGFVFISAAFYLPLYFQSVLGATPILSGVYFFPFVLALSFTSIAVGIFIKKTGQYLPPIWFAVVFISVGWGLFMDLPLGLDWGRLATFQIIAGLGTGPLFQAPLIALQSNVPPRDIATATALFGFVRNLATSASVVIGGVIFQNQMLKHDDEITARLPPDLAAKLGGGKAGSSTGLVQALPPNLRRPVQRAYNDSLQKFWIFYFAISLLGIIASVFIRRRVLDKKHVEYKSGLAQEEKNRLDQVAEDAQKKAEKEERRRTRMSTEPGVPKTNVDNERRGSRRLNLWRNSDMAHAVVTGDKSRDGTCMPSNTLDAQRPRTSSGNRQRGNSARRNMHSVTGMAVLTEAASLTAPDAPTFDAAETGAPDLETRESRRLQKRNSLR